MDVWEREFAQYVASGTMPQLEIIRLPNDHTAGARAGSRSIPIVIALDENFEEVGHWGPRPSELQAWVMANRNTMPKPELYPQVRKWYAKDRGETTLKEVLEAAGFSVAKVA